MSIRKLMLALLIASCLLCGCGGDDDSKPTGPGGTPSGVTVTSAGGTFAFASGQVRLSVPAGAIDSTITVTVTTQTTYPPDTGYVPGTCFSFAPDGQQFNAAVTVTIRLSEANLPADVLENSLALCKVVGADWEPVAGYTVNIDSNTVSAPLTGFSSYGIVGSVTSTEHTYQGNYFITDSASAAEFVQYEAITGKLEIRSDTPDSVILPNLKSIGDILHLYGPPQITHRLTKVRLPSLVQVGSALKIENCDSLAAVDLPVCVSAGSILVQRNATLVDFDGLASISTLNPTSSPYLGGIEVSDNDSLRTLGGFAGLRGSAQRSVTIADNPSLVSVAGLGGISQIGGALEINECRALRSLAGLGLVTCSGNVVIIYNDGLEDLSGLDLLHTVSDIQIQYCPRLTDLTGLGSLTTVRTFDVEHCDGLVSLDGLGSLVTLTGGLYIRNCANLSDITVLHDLTSVALNLAIENCDSLVTLDGLQTLGHVGANLTLKYLGVLDNLDALSSLDHAWGHLHISHNWRLRSITGLHGLQNNPTTNYTLRSVYICGNAMAGTPPSGLTNAAAWNFINAIGGSDRVQETITIEDNG